MKVVWQVEKEKREDQTKKEIREGRTITETLLALARLGLTELEVEKPEKVATGAERPKKAIIWAGGLREAATGAGRPGETVTAGAREPTSLSFLAFRSLPTFLLLLAFFSFRQVFFSAFNKCFLHIFSFFSLLFFFLGSIALSLLFLASVIASLISLLSPQSKPWKLPQSLSTKL